MHSSRLKTLTLLLASLMLLQASGVYAFADLLLDKSDAAAMQPCHGQNQYSNDTNSDQPSRMACCEDSSCSMMSCSITAPLSHAINDTAFSFVAVHYRLATNHYHQPSSQALFRPPIFVA